MKPSIQSEPSLDLSLGVNASLLLVQRTEVLSHRVLMARKKLSAKRVHDLRVASRRLREALSVFEELVGGGGYRKLLRSAKKLTRWPGDVRNLDVRGDLLARVIAEHPGAVGAEECAERLPRERRAARRRLMRRIRAFDLVEMEGRGIGLASKLPLRAPQRVGADRIEAVVKCRLDTAFALKARSLATDDPLVLHRLRIAFKKVRYAVEILHFALGGDLAVRLAPVLSLQTVLGEIHDLDVLSEEIAGGKCGSGGLAELQEVVEAMRRARYERFVADFRPVRKAQMLKGLIGDIRG